MGKLESALVSRDTIKEKSVIDRIKVHTVVSYRLKDFVFISGSLHYSAEFFNAI